MSLVRFLEVVTFRVVDESTGSFLPTTEHGVQLNLVGYDQLLQECKTIENFMTQKLETTEAHLHKHYLENTQRALQQRDLAMYIKGDPQFSEVNQVVMEVAHIRRQLEAIVDALKSLGWSLNNIVKLRVEQLEQTVL